MIRAFVLRRDCDETGISGTGIVAEGVQFLDTKECVLHWLGNHACTNFYKSLEDLIFLHGHQGKTVVVFQDEVKDTGKNNK